MTLPAWQAAYAADVSSPVTAQTDTVNINTATAEQLSEMLTGIGEKRAAAIIAYREANGPFSSLEQLLEVKGVGEKVMEQNRDKMTLK
ncbi:MAG: helix-hairpin-helix domain-containing protein [Gammaproteobacteria bacterium]|nr:MAG: helix-hairpin-helix domain-containing protein [Gammaproteobacteria bacterium]